MTKYIIVDIEEEEVKSICSSKEEIIDFAQEYYDYLFEDDEDGFQEDKRPSSWEMAIDFLAANSRYIFDLERSLNYD